MAPPDARPASPTGFVTSAGCLDHDTGSAHPERPGRLSALIEHLQESGLWSDLDVCEAREGTPTEIGRVHPADFVQLVRDTSARGPCALDGDTTVSQGSYRAARLASGGVIEAVERVASGTWSNAFVAVRPPGHHAEVSRAMGFCLFNHVAVAARHLQAMGIARRVAIVDFDVHHGNGTQHVFEDDPHVYYASLHQWPLYPGTGAARERGIGDGEGATLNVPLPAGSGEREWLGALEGEVLPALEAFRPQFVLVSAGFDAHRDDPLAGTELEDGSYRRMTESLLELARRCAGGRLVSLLEGGYDLGALARAAEQHLGALVAAHRARVD